MVLNNKNIKKILFCSVMILNSQFLSFSQQNYILKKISKIQFEKLLRNNKQLYNKLNIQIEEFIKSNERLNCPLQNNIDKLKITLEKKDSIIIRSSNDIVYSDVICSYKKLLNNNYLILMFTYEIYYYLYVNTRNGKIDTLCSHPYFSKNSKYYVDNCTSCGEYEPYPNYINIYVDSIMGNKISIHLDIDCVISMFWCGEKTLALKTKKNRSYYYYLLELN